MIGLLVCITAAVIAAAVFVLLETRKSKKSNQVDFLYGKGSFIIKMIYRKKQHKETPLQPASSIWLKNAGSGIQSADKARESRTTDYNKHTMTAAEKIRYTAMAAGVLFAVGFIFFGRLPICVLLCALAPLYLGIKKKDIIKRKKLELNSQFKDALYSISSSISAGRSVEGAFKAALIDLKILYPDENTSIIKELGLINRKMEMNETLESALMDFANRADIEDIYNFVDVFLICKNTGGNLVDVIKNTSSIINQKIEIKGDIEVLLAEQKFSQKILNIMPFGLMFLIKASSPDYIEQLYTPQGHIIMLIVLALLGVSYLIGSKIMDIKV